MKAKKVSKNKKRFLSLGMAMVAALSLGSIMTACKDDDSSSSTPPPVEVVTYTVSFNVDGTAVSTETVTEGGKATKPATNPTKEGQVFVGWYKDSAFKNLYDFGETVKGNLTLYARFAVPSAIEFKATLIVDGETFGEAETVGGVFYESLLPTPTKEGATFAGWWTSDYNDATKLTEKCTELAVEQPVKLYAVWTSDAPLVSVNANGVSWSMDKAAQVNLKITKVGEETPVEEKTLNAVSYAFDFNAQPGGDYVVEVTVGEKTGTAYFYNKALAKVSVFSYEGTVLTWNEVENATKYLVSVECGDANHTHVDEEVQGNTYNFANCAMKFDGIKFTVKAVAEGYATSESEVFTVVKNLSATANVTFDATTATITWDAVENATSYKVVVNGQSFMVNENSFDAKEFGIGALDIAVTPVAFGYNSPAAATALAAKSNLATPANIKLGGSVLAWDAVASAVGYVVTIDGTNYDVNTNSFDLSTLQFAESATACTVVVKAIGATEAVNSLASNVKTVGFGVMADTLTYKAGQVAWDPVLKVKKFEVRVNEGTAVEYTADKLSAPVVFTKAGVNNIEVRCYNLADVASDWVNLEVEAYEVKFDYGVGTNNSTPSQYKAVGDTFTIPANNPATPGYQFRGWFNAPKNGVEYTSKTVTLDKAENCVVHATWEANKYKFFYTLNGVDTHIVVTYDQPYSIPVPQRDSDDAFFGGWWSEENGQGIQYTNNLGESVGVWKFTNDQTAKACEVELYEYVEVVSVTTGKPGYSVKAGSDIGKVTQITIPAMYNGLPVIGIEQMGFANCGHLTKISIPDTVETIYLGLDGPWYGTGSALYHCSALEYVDVYEVSGNHQKFYKSIDGALVHMSDYNGVELAYVPYAWNLDEYKIPDEITTIPTNLFRSYKTLKKIIVSKNVTKIDSGAFYQCTMDELVFEEGGDKPLTIGAGVFMYCDFDSITLPARMGELTDEKGIANVFYYCDELEEIKVENGNEFYSAKDGFLYNKEGTVLLYAPRGKSGVITIPVGTITIQANSFASYLNSSTESCKLITKVIIPIGVEKIGAGAFKGCTALVEVEFSGDANDAKIDIDKEAFNATSLASLTIPANIGKIGQYAFGAIKTLGHVVVNAGEGFTVETGAFGDASGNYYVTSIDLGKNVRVFDVNGAFGPTKLSQINIHPENNYLTMQEDVLFDKDITQIVYYPASKTGNYTIPSSIEIIGGNVFNGKSLEEVFIPFTVKEIGGAAFANCARLTKVTFLPSETAGATHNGLKIGDQAFMNCANLIQFTLPTYTKEIGARAFESCESLTGAFNIPEGVTTIGDAAFRYMSGITSISLPKTLEKLAVGTDAHNGIATSYYPEYYRTFVGCDSLTQIEVATGNQKYVTQAGILYAYGDENKATDLIACPAGYAVNDGKAEILGTVRTIWSYAFANNVSLREVSFAAPEYKGGETATTINIEMGKNVFENAKNLKRVTLGTGVQTINDYMFRYCESLEYVFIPNTVNKITHGSPFNGCDKLSEIIFEPGNESNKLIVTGSTSPPDFYTGGGAFYSLDSLTKLEFPVRTEEIGNMALVDNANLQEVFVPWTVKYLGNWLFGSGSNKVYTTGCPNLRRVIFQPTPTGQEDVPLKIGTKTFMSLQLDDFTLPARTISIGNQAFGGSSIREANIPKAITSIGNEAFRYCANLTSVTFDPEAELTSIGNYAFSSSPIKTFVVPAKVETIGQYAFAYTEDLATITFAEGSALKKIDNYAFRQSAISKLELPESTNNIELGMDLFQYCRNLEEVKLSKSVTTAKDTFGHCGSLERVIVAEGNPNFSVEGSTLYNSNKTAIQYLFENANVDQNGVYSIANGITEIGEAAFRGQVGIKKLIIPASVTKIGKSAFRYCVNLEEIVFDLENSQLSEIAESAFEGCSKLKKIVLPTSVTKLGKYAFRDCSSLAEAKINGVKELAGYTFLDCVQLKQIDLSTVVKVGQQDFSRSGLTSVSIPAGMSTGTYMFYQCPDLAQVTLPDGLTSIGNYMFRGCTSLTQINVPATVTTLGNYAFAETGLTSFEFVNPAVTVGQYLFYGCADLKTVKLANGMTTLTRGLFYNCTSLGADKADNVPAVEIPSTIKTIQDYIFYGCTSIKMMEFPGGVFEFGSTSKWSTSTNSYIFYGCTSLKKVVLPYTLERIGTNAFNGCTSLKEVENLDNVEWIGTNVFANSGIESITLPAVTKLNTSAFDGCDLLTNVVLNDDLADIQQYAFRNCTSLQQITLPSALTTFGTAVATGYSRVFQGCTALKSITLPKGIAEIGLYAFEGCTSLEEVNFEGQVVAIGKYAFYNCTSLTTFDWSEFLLSIDDYAFANTGISDVQIAAAANKLSATAFEGCPLDSFEIDQNNVYYKVENNVVVRFDTDEWMFVLPAFAPASGKLVIDANSDWQFAENATPFVGNATITEIEIKADAGWTEIPYGMFYGMRNLVKVTLPEGIVVIDDYAFEDCPKLATINIPSTVTSIGAYAFYGCEALTAVTLPAKLEVIEEYAFMGTKLTSIVIPASVKSIERYAFYGIEDLATVTLNEGLETVGGQAFAGTGIETVTIPASVTKFGSSVTVSDNSGSSNTISSNQSRSFVFAECKNLETVTFLGNAIEMTGSTFKNCTSLTTVNLPQGLKAIEDYMFYGCTALKSVNIPDTVETIGGYAFAKSGIETITIPEKVTVIGQKTLMTDPYQTGSTNGQTNGAYYENAYPNGHVFMGCESLTTVVFEGDVTQIGWYAFEGCTALTTIQLPETVEIIGDYAFANCTALKTLKMPGAVMFIGNNAFENAAIESVVIPTTAVLYNNVFAGWSATQTVNVELSAYKAWSIWNLAWSTDSEAELVWDYAPATQE